MLTLDHISKTFNPGTINEKRALDGLSLHLKPGDFVTVIGGNGAGKSTMLNAVAGVWPVDSGRIILDGVDVTAMPEDGRSLVCDCPSYRTSLVVPFAVTLVSRSGHEGFV